MVGHDSNGDLVKAEMVGKNSDNLVAVYQIAKFIYTEAAVAVAVEGNAEVEMVCSDEILERFWVSGAAVVVDFGVIVGVGVDKLSFGAEVVKNRFADDRGGTIGAVKSEGEAIEIGFAEVIYEVGFVEGEGFGV